MGDGGRDGRMWRCSHFDLGYVRGEGLVDARCYLREDGTPYMVGDDDGPSRPIPRDGSGCEACPMFSSRHIEWPCEVAGIDYDLDDFKVREASGRIGTPVRVRPCGEGFGGRTYLGILVGDLPHLPYAKLDVDTGRLRFGAVSNPLILLPTEGKAVWGAESWWSALAPGDDLGGIADIRDEEIMGAWYMRGIIDMLGHGDGEPRGDG